MNEPLPEERCRIFKDGYCSCGYCSCGYCTHGQKPSKNTEKELEKLAAYFNREKITRKGNSKSNLKEN